MHNTSGKSRISFWERLHTGGFGSYGIPPKEEGDLGALPRKIYKNGDFMNQTFYILNIEWKI